MSNFKWYRKLCGGTWYYNRYKHNGTMFIWERELNKSAYNIKIENYEN